MPVQFDECQHSHIAQQVREQLEKNHELTAKPLCDILHYPWPQYRDYFNHIRSKWKADYQSRLRLNRVSFHGVHVPCVVPVGLDVGVALGCGWVLMNRRNGMLVWNRDKIVLGRLEWWPSTGRVLVWCRKPAYEGKVVQLLANGFTKTELITDLRVWEKVRSSLGEPRATLAIDTGQRLPYLCVELFKESNGIKFKMGDASDPTKAEFEYCLPKYQEKAERTLAAVVELLSKVVLPPEEVPTHSGDQKLDSYVS